MSSSPLLARALGWALALAGANAVEARADEPPFKVQGEACPPGSRPLTFEEAGRDRRSLCRILDRWDVARLAGRASMDGPGYQCRVRSDDRRPLGHALCVQLAEDRAGWDRDGWDRSGRGRGAGANLARAGVARQSSTAVGGVAERAIDGNVDGNFTSGSVTHTHDRAGSWLEIDLGASTSIHRVVVYNRTDCCGDRLNGARVQLSRRPCDGRGRGGVLAERPLPVQGRSVPARAILEFPEAPEARFVCVRQTTREALSIAEIEVFGAGGRAPLPPAPSTPPSDELAGLYEARHPHWSGSLRLFPDGHFERDNGDPGDWSFDGRRLTLAWRRWDTEVLEARGRGRFEARNGFTLVRRGEGRRDREYLRDPDDRDRRDDREDDDGRRRNRDDGRSTGGPADCGTGPSDPGCGLTRGGVPAMDATEYRTLLDTLRGEANELSRKDLLDSMAGGAAITAAQLGPILLLFDNELTKLDVAKSLSGKLVNPRAALQHAGQFSNSFSKKDFVDAMTSQNAAP